MTRTLALGAILTALVTGLLRWQFGPAAVVPGLVFGGLATAIQVGSARAMRGGSTLPFPELLKRYGLGMGLRLGGVGLLVVAVLARRDLFVPLPTALGFLGVLIPMLFLEAKLAR